MARGFDFCWPLNWMAVDLRRLNEEPSGPPGLRVGLVEGEAHWDLDDLPHYSREMAAARFAASKARPRRIWHFGAWLDGQPVGHSTLFVTTGRLGLAGLVTHRIGADGLGDAYEGLLKRKDEYLGVVVRW